MPRHGVLRADETAVPVLVAAAAPLVAPSDVEGPNCPEGRAGFKPMPRQPLGFASVVVASDDGPYASVERGWRFAEAWGSRHVMPGWRGHISSADKLGLWAEGHAFLEELVQTFAPVALDRRHPF